MPKGNKKGSKRNRGTRSLPWVGAAMVGAILVYALYVHFWVHRDPMLDPFKILEGQGYSPNYGLSGLFQPGNVIQIAEKGPDGKERELATPLVFAWAPDCFPDRSPHVTDFTLPKTTGSSSGALTLKGERLTKLLPSLKIESTAVARYKIEFSNVRIHTFARGDLSGSFSSKCVRMLRTAMDSGDKVEWFRVVMESVVADEVLMEIEWKGDAGADVRRAVTEKAEKSLSQGIVAKAGMDKPAKLDVRLAGADEKKTVLSAKGLVILAYRARPIEPKAGAGPGS